MECPNCEAEIEDVINKKFCELCGFELNLKVNFNTEPKKQNNPDKISRRRCC